MPPNSVSHTTRQRDKSHVKERLVFCAHSHKLLRTISDFLEDLFLEFPLGFLRVHHLSSGGRRSSCLNVPHEVHNYVPYWLPVPPRFFFVPIGEGDLCLHPVHGHMVLPHARRRRRIFSHLTVRSGVVGVCVWIGVPDWYVAAEASRRPRFSGRSYPRNLVRTQQSRLRESGMFGKSGFKLGNSTKS